MKFFRYLLVLIFLFQVFSMSAEASLGMPSLSANSIRISGMVPPDLSTQVSVNSPITLEFSGPGVDQAFYQTIGINLFVDGKSIPGELFYNPNTRQVMYKPGGQMQEGQTYTAQLSYRDSQGNPVEKLWSFRTAGGPTFQLQKKTPPSQQLHEPSDFSESVPRPNGLQVAKASMAHATIPSNFPLEITFSEPLDLSTLKDAPIKLFQGKQQYGVDYKLSKDLRTISLIPRNSMNPGSKYNIVIYTQISGASGARLPKNTLIPFKVQSGVSESNDEYVPDNVIEEAPSEEVSPRTQYPNPFQREQTYQARRSRVPSIPQSLPAQPPLTVVGLTPRNGDTVNNLNQPVSVAFSVEVRAETLNEFTFRLEDDFGPVPARIKYFPGRKQAMLMPLGVLDGGKNYRVILTNGVSDPFGRPVQNPLNTSFMTAGNRSRPMAELYAGGPKVNPGPSPDVILKDSHELESLSEDFSRDGEEVLPKRPARSFVIPQEVKKTRESKLSAFRVAAITPTANSRKVMRNSMVVVRFSEPADPSTIDNINISLFGNQRRVEGQVAYDPSRKQATFVPKEKLGANTEYKVVINDKIKSAMGEPLVSRYSWAFVTSNEERRTYLPSKSSSPANSNFSIPLLDRKKTQHATVSRQPQDNNVQQESFKYVPSNHWVFKAIRHISQKGMLSGYPFNHNIKISRYECAMAVKSALENLKELSGAPSKPKLRLKDLIPLENLVIEFRPELKSFGIDTFWFEKFLEDQGVNISEIEGKVHPDRG